MSAPEPGRRVVSLDEADLDDVFAVFTSYLRRRHPREVPLEVIIPFESGRQFRQPWPVPAAGPTTCSHSADFSSVVWFGRPYSFTPYQAAIVALLWAAWEGGCPDVGGAALLEAVGSASGKVSDLFRDAPAWRDGVVGRTGKSSYRLNPPEE
jgi:hypothetical protein